MTIYAPGSHVLLEDRPLGNNVTHVRYGFTRNNWGAISPQQTARVIAEYRTNQIPYTVFSEFTTTTEDTFDEDGNLLTQSFVELPLPAGNARKFRGTFINDGPADLDADFFIDEVIR